MLDHLRALNAGAEPLGSFGAVVGATIGETGDDLDFNGPILAPGYGAQGGTTPTSAGSSAPRPRRPAQLLARDAARRARPGGDGDAVGGPTTSCAGSCSETASAPPWRAWCRATALVGAPARRRGPATPFAAYCDVVVWTQQQPSLGEAARADGGGSDAPPQLSRPSRRARRGRPDDIADDWSVVVQRLSSPRTRPWRPPGSTRRRTTPWTRPTASRRRSRTAIDAAGAGGSATEAVARGPDNIQQQARDVCKTEARPLSRPGQRLAACRPRREYMTTIDPLAAPPSA